MFDTTIKVVLLIDVVITNSHSLQSTVTENLQQYTNKTKS